MLTDRGRRISVCKLRRRDDNCYGGFVDRSESCRGDLSPSRILCISSPTSSPPSPPSPARSSGGGYIEHRVSKYDTLAGIAIKYGVEVADVTKLNGLVTDLQMFALKSLRIPLPGRHPPSPCLSNTSLNHGQYSSEEASPLAINGNIENVFDSFHSLRLKPSETKVSPAMNSLQGYYGLKPKNKRASERFDDDVPTTNTPPLNHHRKSRSLVDAVIAEVNQSSTNPTNVEGVVEQSNCDKPVKRRQKSEADFDSGTPELLLKEENVRSGVFSTIPGTGLALRTKASSKTNLLADNVDEINLMDAPLPPAGGGDNARKSFSATCLQEPNCNSNNNGLFVWPTSKWCLTPELITQAALASSIFDGLPKPLISWINKKAVD